ncbi:Uncharacterised protein [uncultured Ruminococcus sp.]|nr:Uncharacterised protein [uncultured Ruminococcus sp.]
MYNNAVDEVKADFNSHAHVERDCGKTARKGSRNHFNSHAHVERDKILNLAKRHAIISTHTLTWSVTLYTYIYTYIHIHFNSHAHVERDMIQLFIYVFLPKFQLTRSRGA